MGYTCNPNHTSTTCTNQRKGHKTEAMIVNAIGDNMKHHQKYVERKDLWWLGNTSMWRKIINSENVKILKHKAFFFSITSHTYTTAIVDTSTADDFFPLSLESLTNIQ